MVPAEGDSQFYKDEALRRFQEYLKGQFKGIGFQRISDDEVLTSIGAPPEEEKGPDFGERELDDL
jgi:hypothetical protein